MATKNQKNARIRSIKPEFWTDEKIAELPKATALFFIALWNFADDQGVIEDSSRGLSLRIPIFRSQDIEKMLMALWKAGLIARAAICSECFKGSPTQCERCLITGPSPDDTASLTPRWSGDGLVMVRGWHHQYIERPRDGKWKHLKIQWLASDISPIDRDSSVTGSDRIGSDRKGGDRSANPLPDPFGSEDQETREARAWAERQELEEAEEYYRIQYQVSQKTRAKPLVTDVEREALVALYRIEGMTLKKLMLLINTYLWMENEWFDSKGRSLVTLKKELSRVFSKAAASGQWPADTPAQPQGATA